MTPALKTAFGMLFSALGMTLALSLPAQETQTTGNGKIIRIDFEHSKLDSDGIPEGWVYKGKIGTPDPVYEIVKDPVSGKKVLKITADRASGAILFDMKNISLEKYPYMRWKWMVEKLPDGADGLIDEKDDQGIAVYMGSGRFTQTSVAYRWENLTAKGTKGQAKYGAGFVKVFWEAMRNYQDGTGKWYTDECNVREDLKKALDVKKIPEKNLALSISSNSQYTGTKAVSYLEYIEFLELPPSNKQK